jgi:hypothetical protein
MTIISLSSLPVGLTALLQSGVYDTLKEPIFQYLTGLGLKVWLKEEATSAKTEWFQF